MPYAIHTSLVNETEGYIFSEWTEDLGDFPTDHLMNDDGTPDFGAIYRSAQSEYGRCTSSVYVDVEGGPPKRCGWFFVSRQEYEGSSCRETYLRGAWVTVVERIPERHIALDIG